MDFVQRNLINERNNLQIELAKANILIAQLSEAYSNMPKDENSNQKSKNSADMQKHEIGDTNDYQVKKNTGKYLAAKRTPPSKRHFTPEQTQYISDLENVIATIAESINVPVEDLIEEKYSYNKIKSTSGLKIIKTPSKKIFGEFKRREPSGKGNTVPKSAVDVPTKPVTDKDWAMSSVTHRNGIIQKPSDGMEHLIPITQAHHKAHHAMQTLHDRARANPNNPEHQRKTFRVDTSIIDRSKVTPENPRGEIGPSWHRGHDDNWGETKQEWIAAKENLDRHDNLRQRALRDVTQRHTDSYAGRHHTNNAYPSTYSLERYLGKVDHPMRRDNTPEMRKTFGKFNSADHGTLTPHVSHIDQLQAHVDSLPTHVRAAREAHPEAKKIMREKARLAQGPRDYNNNPATDHPRDAWIKERHADQTARNQKDYLNLFRNERPKHRQR